MEMGGGGEVERGTFLEMKRRFEEGIVVGKGFFASLQFIFPKTPLISLCSLHNFLKKSPAFLCIPTNRIFLKNFS